jgi:RNA polymerase sigma-54 factor
MSLRQELAQRQVQVLTPSQILLADLLEVPEERVMDAVEELVRANPALAKVLDIPDAQAESWRRGRPMTDDDLPAVGENDAAESTLVQDLVDQVRLERTTDEELEAAIVIIGHLDGRGLLEVDLDEIAERAGVDLEDAESAQLIVMNLDPPGCGARTPAQYLAFMVEETWPDDPVFPDIVRDHLDALSKKRFDKIARAMDLDPEDVEEYHRMLVEEIDPWPARGRAVVQTDFVRPTMTIGRDTDGHWRVRMHDEARVGVKLDPAFVAKVESMPEGPERRAHLQQIHDAQEVVRQLEQRHSLVKQVAELAVFAQRAFFDDAEDGRGDAATVVAAARGALRPLRMDGLARLLRRDASTVSRAVTGRYFRWKHGVMGLRELFNHRSTADDEHSVHAVRAAVRRLIDAEDRRKPLSDEAIARALEDAGFAISRRTVQKHREHLNIPSSRDRRQR